MSNISLSLVFVSLLFLCFSTGLSKCHGNATEMEELVSGAEGFIYSSPSRQWAAEAVLSLQGPHSENIKRYYLQFIDSQKHITQYVVAMRTGDM